MTSIEETNKTLRAKTNETLRAKELRLGRGMLYALTISTTLLTYSTLLLHEPRPVSAATAATTAVELLTWTLLAVTATVALTHTATEATLTTSLLVAVTHLARGRPSSTPPGPLNQPLKAVSQRSCQTDRPVLY